jgi:hypothetical protein
LGAWKSATQKRFLGLARQIWQAMGFPAQVPLQKEKQKRKKAIHVQAHQYS